ncbi:MAG: asparagine synthase (glutamine-hydrolyzing) [bacterium]|nr:asparagine synthase (glutamine-hydrolyzing) [bacterium]
MCGIAGYIGTQPPDDTRAVATLATMHRRGPDAQRFVRLPMRDRMCVFLHTRLSIIDLDPRAHLPMTIGGCTLIFNGEIYNYLELRKCLEARGIVFRTTSDSEVLLQSYLTFGERCVDDFEGMWAFAIHDARSQTVFLSRDRFGEKPLYLLETTGGVLFGSEIKFLAALSGQRLVVNTPQVLRYLVNGYKSLMKGSETFFQGVREVPYATNVIVQSDGAVRSYRYWQPHCTLQDMTLADAVEGFRARLLESMRIRLRADVPLAFCLSGGVDSASLASIAAKEFGYRVATFSVIDHDPRYNEEPNIQEIVADIGSVHTAIPFPQPGFFERLEQLIAYHDAPIATISYFVHSYLSEAIAHAGYRVAISGTAADELVTGYYDHFPLHLYEMRNHPAYARARSDFITHVAPMVRNPLLRDPDLYSADRQFRGHVYDERDRFLQYVTVDFREEFREHIFCDSLLRNRMLNELFHEVVPVILREDDLNSMYYSVENRSPYLDTRLCEFAFRIPAEHLIRDGYGKYVLREAMRGTLHDRVRLDRQKKGFNVSLASLIDLRDGAVRERILAPGRIFDLVDRRAVAELMDANPLPNSTSKFLFNVINAQLFLAACA